MKTNRIAFVVVWTNESDIRFAPKEKYKRSSGDTLVKVFLSMMTTFTYMIHLLVCKLRMLSTYFFRRRRLLASHLATTRHIIRKVKRRQAARKNCKRPGRMEVWWTNLKVGKAVESEWKENLRMSRTTFYELPVCDEVRPYISALKLTKMRRPLSVETQVALTSYFLADGGRMRKTANAFGCGSIEFLQYPV